MNRVETALVNSGPRARLQRHYEVPLLARIGGRLDGASVVEIGCGRGVGTQALIRQLGAAHVTAVDLDPAMVARARARLRRYGPRARVEQGDATALPVPDASADAVVDFAVIHHVPAWREAITEVARVLRPGGRFFFSEVTAHALGRWSYRTFLDHPTEDRFTAEEFTTELARAGLVLATTPVTKFFGDFVLGVASRPTGPTRATTPTAVREVAEPVERSGRVEQVRQAGMPVLSLSLFAVWALLAGVGRLVLQRARSGDSGFRFTAAKRGTAQWWANRIAGSGSLLLGVGAPLADLAGAPGARPLPVLHRRGVHRVGAALTMAGITATCAAQLAMGSSWRIGVDPRERTALVTSGPFALVRNPIFTAATATSAGMALMVPNRLAATGLALVCAGIQAQVRLVEEPYLRRSHGSVYADYAARTGRFLPRLGR